LDVRGARGLRDALHGHRETPLPPLLAVPGTRLRLGAGGVRARGGSGRGGRMNSRVRIVDVINLSSSADTLLRERVLSLRAKGVDNRIVCIDGPYVKPLRAAGIPVDTVHLPRGLDPLRLVASLIQMYAYFRRVKPDLVHTHCSVPGIVGRLAARLAGVPVVVHTVHGFAFHDGSRGPGT